MGPYLSNGENTDSSFIKHFITSNSGSIRYFLKEVLIVNKGYTNPF